MIDAPPLARYYFVPAIREGLAAYITADSNATPDRERALIPARLSPMVSPLQPDEVFDVVAMRVGLFGPGDVLGFDPLVVTRTDPRANVWDFEPNYMPIIEFSEPDLPWRFTPDVAATDGTGLLQPWLTLIVLKDGEFQGLDERPPEDRDTGGLPIRWINGVVKAALPDLSTAWRWAHVHMTHSTDLGDSSIDAGELQTAVMEELSAEPGTSDSHIVSRLICPRRLEPQKHYTAFVVPTFKSGQVAAGLASLGSGESAVTPGWDASSPETIALPYYYRFEFGTSVKGDFEYLVRLLEPRPLPDLGKRRMDCSSLAYSVGDCPGRVVEVPDGPPVEDPHVLDLEGALMSPGREPGQWHNEGTITDFRSALARILNLAVARTEPDDSESTDAAKPKVVPPIFGRRHAQRFRVDPGSDEPWLEDVNLDPRQRAAGGFGALVVEKEQEALMASVWDQLGDIEDANQAIAHGQLGVEASKGIYRRFGTLSVPDFLWASAPVLNRVPLEGSGTVSNHLAQSPIPAVAFDGAFRRVLRRGSGLRKRQQNSQQPPPFGRDLLSRLNEADIAAAGPPPTPAGMPSLCSITDAALSTLEAETAPQRQSDKKYHIVGRVIDHWSRARVRNVRVEVWDKDPFYTDLATSTVTDDRGTFTVAFDPSYYREFALDPLPDVFFKVLKGEHTLKVLAPGLLRNLQAGDTSVVIEVDQSSSSNIPLPFHVTGQVLDRATGKGIPWLRIEAWDKDFFNDDLVGGAVTDADGAFAIRFSASYSKEWFTDKRPDLYFRVFRGPDLLANTKSDVTKNVKPGETSVVVRIDAPALLPPQPGSRVSDFCEAAVTCDSVRAAIASSPSLGLHALTGDAICDGIQGWLNRTDSPDPRNSVDLLAVAATIKTAIDPTETIPSRVMRRLKLRPGVHQRRPLDRLESDIDFPQPMYEPLAAISQDLILPGVETVPQNTISILKTNRRFMEGYMLAINDAVISECVWRGAPVYVWTTCAKQFWDVRGLVEPEAEAAATTKDITRIATWSGQSALGSHDPRATGDSDEPVERAVLLVRGDVLKRYPNTFVYAIEAGENGKPALAEYQTSGVDAERKWPIFSGSLAPDLTFLGFDLTPTQMCTGGSYSKGYFIVLEQRLGEARFGFDLQQNEEEDPEDLSGPTWWYDVTWSHLQPAVLPGDYINDRSISQASTLQPTWGYSSAVMANIALQRPVRMSVHASKMLPKSVCEQPQSEVSNG